MSTNDQDQRKSFRCPVGDGAQDAEIQAGSLRMRVRLFNESAGGFAVVSEHPFPVKCGDILQICTSAGCYEARVVHMARPGLGDPVQWRTRRPSYQLGLERVREIPRSSRGEVARAGWWPSLQRHWLNPFRTTSGDYLSLLLLLVLIPTAVGLYAWSHHRSLASWLLRGERAARSDAAEETIDLTASLESAGAPQSASTSTNVAALSTLRADEKTPLKAAPSVAALSRLVRRLPDASVFRVPEIANHLSLDYAQQWQIGRLIEATKKALAKIDQEMAQATPEAREQSRRSIQETARDKAIRLLSNQQRERWAALVGGDPPAP